MGKAGFSLVQFSSRWYLYFGWLNVAYVYRNRRLIRDGSPGRPHRLSHSSWALSIFVLGKVFMHSTPSLRCFPNVTFETVSVFVWLTMALSRPFEEKETSEHYILHCPRFTHVRQNTIFKLPANLLNITTLLRGDPNISNNMNSLIFKTVQDFIVQSGRFDMEWQTQLNSY